MAAHISDKPNAASKPASPGQAVDAHIQEAAERQPEKKIADAYNGSLVSWALLQGGAPQTRGCPPVENAQLPIPWLDYKSVVRLGLRY